MSHSLPRAAVLLGTAACFSALALSGCGGHSDESASSTTSPSSSSPSPSPSSSGFDVPSFSSDAPLPSDGGSEAPTRQNTTTNDASIDTRLVRVIDGDTIAVKPTKELPATNAKGTEAVVNLLGVDAPDLGKSADENECGADKAVDHLKRLLTQGGTVYLTYDAKAPHKNADGVTQAYISDGALTDINLTQVADGYAVVAKADAGQTPSRLAEYQKAADTATFSKLGTRGDCADASA